MTDFLSCRTENQWPYVRDGGALDLLRVSAHTSPWGWSAGVTLLGLGVGLTWWRRKPVRVSGFDKMRAGLEAACLDSPSNRGLSGWVNAQPIKPGESFQFHEDPWPEGVPVESLGREHGA